MMDVSVFYAQTQVAHWGWTIALFLWFVGLSGMGMFLNNWIREKAIVYLCCFAAIVGTLLVMSHLHRILNLPWAAITALMEMSFNFTSWMFIGICLLVIQCCLTLFASLVHAGVVFKCDCFKQFVNGNCFSWAAAFIGVACTIYSGFLLTQAVGVTFWNTAIIPILWIISGTASAFGCIELLMLAGKIPHEKIKWARGTILLVEAFELCVIFALVHVGLSSTSAAARMGAQSLVSGDQSVMFWIGAVILGSIIPIVLNLFVKGNKALAVSAFLGVVGALLLRASVLFAGYYEPILL